MDRMTEHLGPEIDFVLEKHGQNEDLSRWMQAVPLPTDSTSAASVGNRSSDIRPKAKKRRLVEPEEEVGDFGNQKEESDAESLDAEEEKRAITYQVLHVILISGSTLPVLWTRARRTTVCLPLPATQ